MNITEEQNGYPQDDNSKIEEILKKHNERVPRCSCHIEGGCKGC